MPSRILRLWRQMNAAQLAVLSFAALILLGTVLLLLLPVSTVGSRLSFVDALFTATSATCVTGLVVVDTGTAFTHVGQTVILGLIQVGGFGIMTLSTFILFMMGRRASLRMSDAAAESYPKMGRYTLGEMLRKALVITLGIEAVGALILFVRWWPEYGPGRGLWMAVFHSVSAFCNAGFGLLPDSLTRYAGDPTVNLTVMLLIILGGIGFFVLIDLWGTVTRHPDPARRRVSFHTKVVLGMSAFLILGGALFLLGLEYRHQLAGLPWHGSLFRAFFQSITARTAGFNTVDIGSLSNASLFVILLLMFIGGAPGSMAGGVKVTSAGVVFIVVASRLRGLERSSMFGRSLQHADVERALTVIVLAVGLAALFTTALLTVELGGVTHDQSRGTFLEIAFEYVSAFGTVGLSMGVTPQLTTAGRLLLTIVMFVGRLGPLTLVYALERRRARLRFHYPEEEILVG